MLAGRAPEEIGCVQVIVAAQRGTGSGRLALRLLDAVVSFVEEMGREFTRMNASASAGAPRRVAPAAVDPVAAVRSRAVVAKKACGPHLRVTVRVAVAGPAHDARLYRAQVGLIADGFDAVATAGDGLITRRVCRPAVKVGSRRPGAGFVVTVAELGALWHIPADAAVYGIATTDARTRAPHRDLPRLDDPWDRSLRNLTPEEDER
ncbi:hypothetical protein [Nocardia brasiliensis]|uniref:hypothetical protein n=1 Tax=Nocardia brasiliensis TaxID=37326 RepID=UPI001895A67B|nr:hypothetical protein [Nocardia brasiliensis]MBF6131148.1 hypothetical protein [Nocardia brasiliensis]